jgi:hypothetical protein
LCYYLNNIHNRVKEIFCFLEGDSIHAELVCLFTKKVPD